MNKNIRKSLESKKGITLIMLVITIIILLILAAVSLNGVFNDKGIFNRAETAGAKYNEAKAREVLETILMADGQYEKHINPKYDQDEFLNQLIINEIPGTEIKGDVAIVSGWAFELDRSVPKIGRGLGKADKLIFPTINAEAKLATDKKNATINITAKEEKNGINKIEIWLLGEKIKEYTYDPTKPEATETYVATQNGEYTIKAYGDLWSSTTVEVTGIVASVTFEPSGNTEWKKEHSTTVTIQETADKVVKAKYVWTNSVNIPEDNQFPEEQILNSGDTITKNELTGTYYLWTMLETKSGEKLKWRSEGFNFDNEGPQITSFTSTAVNYSSFKINTTAIDKQSGIVEYEFFVNNTSKGKITVNEIKTSNSQEITVTNENYGNNACYVIVKDKLGNQTRQDITAQTLIDTTGPTITSFTATKYSETGITLSATAQDTGTGVTKFEFYIDGTLKSEYTQTMTATTSSVTKTVNITGITTGNHTCMVKVYDAEKNSSTSSKSGTTKLYVWYKYNTNSVQHYGMKLVGTQNFTFTWYADTKTRFGQYSKCSAKDETGEIILSNSSGGYAPSIGYWRSHPSDDSKVIKFVEEVSRTYGEGNKCTSVYKCGIYESEKTTVTYSKGSNLLGTATSNVNNEYPSGRRKRRILVYI